ncbi:DUF3566 domain-containing protein [Corynebacterium aquilae]|uniref:DUF3566 domain-containing protein n=1 Tax=Corynebacterium aquilae DSM 44791 TaxID=1431546 RepID=A0A1L7CD16_9CORY|nr:DUF3566 domain-containing protein [Corynebacterium aquilae]APT83750.1 hypothetical protein CAQU_00055 [Corynebacterium aquilae DSM 44791]
MATRKVSIQHISAPSVFRVAVYFGLAAEIAIIIATTVVYMVMDAIGIWTKLNDIIGGAGGEEFISLGLAVSVAAALGGVFVLMSIVLAPLAAVLYNQMASPLGTIDVTLSN